MNRKANTAPDALRAALADALGDRYDLLRLLGRGAMGAVYLARERALERLVAIKVLPLGPATTPDARERFRREARIAARLTHPNILPLYGFGEVGDLAYFVMGYVHGQSLGDRLRTKGRLPGETVRRIVAQLADALDYAHRHGVVHRDVKPANILIDDESGRPILADFGVAKALSAGSAGVGAVINRGPAVTDTGVAIGTPRYMSPEQALGAPIDGRSDIYSLGVVAYEMLTGRPPFGGTNAYEVVLQHATNEPPSLQTAALDAPGDLVAAITRCLAKSPDMRWPDGRSLHEALAPDVAEEDVLPRDVSELLPGFGVFAAVWAVAWGLLAAFAFRTPGERSLLALIALLVPIGFLLNAWSMMRKGYRVRLVVRVAFWPPKWWGMWWPRAWRRPGDVWARLPRAARAVRLTITAMLVGVPALIAATHALGATPALTLAPYVLVAATVAATAYGAWWARRHGVVWDDIPRVMLGSPVGSSFWGRPDVARLLVPPAEHVEARDAPPPRTAHEYVAAIAELARALAGPSRAVGSEAVAASRRIIQSIDALDAELQSLQDAAAPAEAERLEQRIVALATADTADHTERHAMRGLLESQLELIRRIRARLDEAAARRAHLVELLRSLSRELGDLHRRGPEPTDAAREIADRVRGLCREAGGGDEG